MRRVRKLRERWVGADNGRQLAEKIEIDANPSGIAVDEPEDRLRQQQRTQQGLGRVRGEFLTRDISAGRLGTAARAYQAMRNSVTAKIVNPMERCSVSNAVLASLVAAAPASQTIV